MFNAAMDLGAKAYVLKENAANDILTALEKVDEGEGFVSASMLEAGQRRSDRVRELLLSKPQIEVADAGGAAHSQARGRRSTPARKSPAAST